MGERQLGGVRDGPVRPCSTGFRPACACPVRAARAVPGSSRPGPGTVPGPFTFPACSFRARRREGRGSGHHRWTAHPRTP